MTVLNTEPHDFQVLPELRFHLQPNECSFKIQYSEIYKSRLSASKPVLLQLATSKWAKDAVPTRFLAELVMNEKCIIAGTLFKEMKLKPSILREIASADTDNTSTSNLLSSLDNETMIRLISEDDRLFLEDEVQRIALRFSSFCQQDKKLTLANLATGVVVAALGCELESEPGIFQVEDMLFLEPQPEHPIQRRSPSFQQISPQNCISFKNSGPWLCCLSGLGFTSHNLTQPNYMLSIQLLGDWLRCGGQLGNSASSQSDSPLGIVRLMILGDSIQTPTTVGEATGVHQQARYLTRHTKAESVSAMLSLDEWLANLPLGPGMETLSQLEGGVQPNGIAVDLLPGSSDPAAQLLPQQPMSPIVLPISWGRHGKYLSSHTNPYSFQVANRRILATSGQGVNDLFRYTELETSCDRMEATLLWGHLAPTCPDTLSGYPLTNQDKLLLSLTNRNDKPNCSPDYPDIYIAGCQPGTKPSWRRARLQWTSESPHQEQGALLVSVPRFDTSFCAVLIHLDTLDCRVVYFDTLISEVTEN